MPSKINVKTLAENRQTIFELARRAKDGEILDSRGMSVDETVDAMFALMANNKVSETDIRCIATDHIRDGLPETAE